MIELPFLYKNDMICRLTIMIYTNFRDDKISNTLKGLEGLKE